MFLFFFDGFKRGMVCRVVHSRHGDDGKKVVIHQINGDMFWCYENRPVSYRTNRKGEKVIDFDPACFLTPYSSDALETTNDIPLQTDGWGAVYRRNRMI